MARRWSAFAFVLALFCLAPGSNAQTSDQAVKAAFLYRFASFVTWPGDAFANSQAPLTLCVLDDDPFASALNSAVSGQHIDQHGFSVRRLASLADARQCQVLYAVGGRADDAVRSVRGAPVLTVTDAGGGSDARGVIHFVVIGDRVRFYADDAQAAENHLAISSRLLALAVSVRRRSGS